MAEELESLLTLRQADVPDALRTWLEAMGASVLLVSLELLDDGRLVIQGVPDVDPSLVARVRRTMAQHEDVLRRLS
jgi:hypothetical protein